MGWKFPDDLELKSIFLFSFYSTTRHPGSFWVLSGELYVNEVLSGNVKGVRQVLIRRVYIHLFDEDDRFFWVILKLRVTGSK